MPSAFGSREPARGARANHPWFEASGAVAELAWILLILPGEVNVMRDLTVGDQLDQYGITDLLARSGMASIFKAVDRESGGAVVLKVPHPQLESDVAFYERFQREEEIGRRLDHPHVVRILAPKEKSRMYLAMEFVEGPSLRALLRGCERMETARALDLARQLCEALSYLHHHGIVHRDVKPENVLLAAPGGQVKLLDFGIALLDSARRLTWAGLSGTLGTPDYMAPEQVRGRRGDGRTDVYAVGTILYEMLTGHLPHDAPNAAAMMHTKTHRAPTPPRVHAPDLHPSLEAIVLKAVARDPRDRHATAEALLADLREPFAPRSSEAEQVATSAPARGSWTRRIALAVLLVAALAAGVATVAEATSRDAGRAVLAELDTARGPAHR